MHSESQTRRAGSSPQVQRLQSELQAAQDLAFVSHAEHKVAEGELKRAVGTAQAAAKAALLHRQAAEQRADALALQVAALQESLSLSESGRVSAQRRYVDRLFRETVMHVWVIKGAHVCRFGFASAAQVADQLGEGLKARYVSQYVCACKPERFLTQQTLT